MKPATLTALVGSWWKWDDIYEGKGTNEGPDNCPLCQLFLRAKCPFDCRITHEVCPVQKHAGFAGCTRTPYSLYVSKPTPANALAERDFLGSLIPGHAWPCEDFDW